MDRVNYKRRIIGLMGLVFLFSFLLIFGSASTEAKADEKMKLNVYETAIAKDGIFRLRVYNVPKDASVTYRSSDQSVAFVDGRGYITGISNGECIVTATVSIGKTPLESLSCVVTVGPAAISIKLTKSEIVLGLGMKKTLKTIISPLNTVEKPVFYSSDKAVATVSSIGRVRAKGIGAASIFAFLLNGESAECLVYVLDEDDFSKYNETGTLVGIIEGYFDEDSEEPDKKVDEQDSQSLEDSGKDNQADKSDSKDKVTPEPSKSTSGIEK